MFTKLSWNQKVTSCARGGKYKEIPSTPATKISLIPQATPLIDKENLFYHNQPAASVAVNKSQLTTNSTAIKANWKTGYNKMKTSFNNFKGKGFGMKKGTTFGIKDSKIYQMGMWPMALVSTIIGLVSNIQAATQILNQSDDPQTYNQNGYGNYRSRQSSDQTRYAITASRMQPFLRLKANPADAVISFGAPWFF